MLDVFTREPLAGNPLAVFVDQDISDAVLMQRIARELNLSETVFVSSGAEGGWPTRIFTPSTELPFAGHPTVGTAVLLASLGLASREVVLAEGVGDVRVALRRGSDGIWTGELTTATLPVRVEVLPRDTGAAAIGVSSDDLHPDLEPAVWDCGVAFAIVGVRDVETLGRTRGVGVIDPFVFVVSPSGAALDATWRARMFATSGGIAEDPATGSAAAAFAGFVAEIDAVRDRNDFAITQGVEMGRSSELRVSFDRGNDGAPTAVRVAGEAVVVGGGTLRL